ncbi:PepSY domain-containing protein [Mammaliicoccus sp. Dog046]|uniref:PepSY domain-containing protein n=1 Tax=Mammaliicoccus sp. Dog046 TaxID=3034233 RepID=UPI002B259318|nr:PepSY domain-containing protein [Mammaliicoccus sp. Dog046]WQK84527.1 PepSY domain-containing protein [Mammaliicoccus sp. Dog046]
MNKAIKPLLLLLMCALFVVLMAVIYLKSTEKLMTEKEARELVTERYTGHIIKLDNRKDHRIYDVEIKDKNKLYSVEIDRLKGTIKNVDAKITEKKKVTKTTKAKEKNKPKEQNKQKKTGITEKKAKQIVMQEVGGTFVSIKKNEHATPVTYSVTHHVGHNEGAVVTVNAINGKVNAVSWFNIEQTEAQDNDTPVVPNQPTQEETPINPPQQEHIYDNDDDDFDDDDGDDD